MENERRDIAGVVEASNEPATISCDEIADSCSNCNEKVSVTDVIGTSAAGSAIQFSGDVIISSKTLKDEIDNEKIVIKLDSNDRTTDRLGNLDFLPEPTDDGNLFINNFLNLFA